MSRTQTGCPWRPANKVYNSKPIIELHEEIEDFFNYITPNPEEHSLRLSVVKEVTGIIKQLWPFAQVEVFGSFRTGLYLPTSDLDLIVVGDWLNMPLRSLQSVLERNGMKRVEVIGKAKVPIVKFTHARSEIKVDVSFNNKNGVQSAELIKSYKQQFPSMAKLVVILKQFLLQRGLNEVYTGGLSSYSLILMMVSFFQVHRRNDCGSPSANLGVLLMEFFELYGRQFNYDKVMISCRGGGNYAPKSIKHNWGRKRPSILAIEDPLDTTNDIGSGSYGMPSVKRAFEYAHITLSQATNPNAQALQTNSSSILGRIIQVSDTVIEYRKRIKQNFPLANGANGRSSDSGSECSSEASFRF